MANAAVTALAEMGINTENKLILNDLLTAQLQGVKGTEVIVSITTIGPYTTAPKHWHPGEEFAYVLEGSFTLWQEGKPDQTFKKGDVGVVPLKQIHTISTGEEGASILVFRVHESNQPERVLA